MAFARRSGLTNRELMAVSRTGADKRRNERQNRIDAAKSQSQLAHEMTLRVNRNRTKFGLAPLPLPTVSGRVSGRSAQITGAEKDEILAQFGLGPPRKSPPQASGLGQAPIPKKGNITAAQREASRLRDEQHQLRALEIMNAQRAKADARDIAKGRITTPREPLTASELIAPVGGVQPDTRIHGVPLAGPPKFLSPPDPSVSTAFKLPEPFDPRTRARFPLPGQPPAISEEITGDEKAEILAQFGMSPESSAAPLPEEGRDSQAVVQIPGVEPPPTNMLATSPPLIRPSQKIQGRPADGGTISSGAGSMPGGITTTGSRPLPWRTL